MKKIIATTVILSSMLLQAKMICGNDIDIEKNNMGSYKKDWIVGFDLNKKLTKYEKKENKEICKVYENDNKQIVNYSVYRKIEVMPKLPEKMAEAEFSKINLIDIKGKNTSIKSYSEYSALNINDYKMAEGFYQDKLNNKVEINVLCMDKNKKCGYNVNYYTKSYKNPEPPFNIKNINEKVEKIKQQQNFK